MSGAVRSAKVRPVAASIKRTSLVDGAIASVRPSALKATGPESEPSAQQPPGKLPRGDLSGGSMILQVWVLRQEHLVVHQVEQVLVAGDEVLSPRAQCQV